MLIYQRAMINSPYEHHHHFVPRTERIGRDQGTLMVNEIMGRRIAALKPWPGLNVDQNG